MRIRNVDALICAVCGSAVLAIAQQSRIYRVSAPVPTTIQGFSPSGQLTIANPGASSSAMIESCDAMVGGAWQPEKAVSLAAGNNAVNVGLPSDNWFHWNGLRVLNNRWGQDAGYDPTGTQVIRDNKDGTVSWEYSWAGDTEHVKGYPAVIAGWHYGDPAKMWGDQWATAPGSYDLPSRVYDEHPLVTNADAEVPNDGASIMNLSWDIWLANTDNPTRPDFEIMVWPWRSQQQPIGWTYGSIATVEFWGATWNLFSDNTTVNGVTWPVFAFVRSEYATQTGGDLQDFVQYLSGIRNDIPSSAWIVGVEFGAEVVRGTGRVTLSRYEFNGPASDYLVVDLSAGPAASSYPVTYLSAVPPGGWSDVYKTTKLVMRRIPAGTFTRGAYQVTLTKDFYIGVFEVTQKQWEQVMGSWPSYFNNTTYRDSRPVERVSYYEIRENPANSAISPNWPQSSEVHADSFMGKLRVKTGLVSLDLPTESQWEYACRAGTATSLNSGKTLTSATNCPNMSEVGRYWYNGGSGYTQNSDTSMATSKVGSYLPNQWGLYDMHGNIWEWCLDWFGTYPGTVTDPAGAASGSTRMVRGGNWACDAYLCTSGARSGTDPSYRSIYSGFRLSRTLP